MKYIAAISIIAFLFTNVEGQDRFMISVGVGMGGYNMSDLKDLQSQHFRFADSELKLIDNFPMYPYYTGDVSVRFAKIFRAGLSYRFQSTGAKSAYSDYSGLVTFEQTVSAKNAGVILGVDIHEWNKFKLSSQLKTYYGWTRLVIEENYEIGAMSYHPEIIYKYKSIMLNPEVTFSYAIANNLSAGVSAGYCIDFKDDNETYSLYSMSGKTLSPDWSGIRIGLVASFTF